jgi:hypothetical protein
MAGPDQIETDTAAPRHPFRALALLVPAPTLGALGMLFWFTPPLNTIWSALFKVWILVLPAVWHRYVDRDRYRWPTLPRRGWAAGIGTGVAIFIIMYAAYWLIGRHWIDQQMMRELAAERGFDDPIVYLGLAVYICLFNALLEEYVWRWFVARQAEALTGRTWAGVLLSGLLFTVHHVFALAAWFDWRLVLLGSIGVFVGGVTWSWLYLRYRSIWPAYVSHFFPDVAIFLIGWHLIFG